MVDERSFARILIVEDESIVARDLRNTLEDLGYTVVGTAASGEDAIAKARALRPAAILMDIRLNGQIDGIQAAAQIRSERDIPIVFLTAHSNDETLDRATKTEPFGYLVKPFRTPDLRCALEIAMRKHEVMRRLRGREHWLASTLQSIGDGVIATDADRRVLFMNPVAEALTGWKREDAIGKALDDILKLIGQDDGKAMASPLDRALQSGGIATLAADAVLIARDGAEVPVGDSAAAIVGDSGQLLGGVIVFRDASEARHADEEIRQMNADLERRVVERTTELEAAVEELDAFSYSVAHDLGAPLRAIEGYSKILIDDHGDALDPEARTHLDAVQKAARRMRALFDDLLHLARCARIAIVRAPVDLSAIARGVIDRLRASEPQRAATVEIAEGIVVHGDERLLRIALENLLGNAWKFTCACAAARIEVGTMQQDGAAVCFVRDNGAGFDLGRAGQLFGAFQRFHATSDFEGTGLGLAIVHRIITRHGGRIWADSAAGAGTTMFFIV